MTSTIKDCVLLENLQYNAQINKNSKNLLINTVFHTDFDRASLNDDLKYSINYAVVARNFKDYESQNSNVDYPSVVQLGSALLKDIIHKQACDSASIAMVEECGSFQNVVKLNDVGNDELKFHNLSLDVIIGIFTFERFKKQPIKLDIDVDIKFDRLKDQYDFLSLGNEITQYLAGSNFKTVEAMVLNVNKLIYKLLPHTIDCNVKVLKTDIIDFTDVGVSTRKTIKDIEMIGTDVVNFDQSEITTEEFTLPKTGVRDGNFKDGEEHDVYLAFGSNEGHQLNNILESINELNKHEEIKVIQTSSLYKSKPMYYLDQPDFINGCLKIKTTLSPQELLKYLKNIEYNSLKRIKKFDNGPRSIDLDILLYDDIIINDSDLNIPHIRMIERTFVLVPLCELIPPMFIHPVTTEPIHNHLQQLTTKNGDTQLQESDDLITLIPLPTRFPMNLEQSENNSIKFRYLEYDLINNKTPTQLMSILNVTPDSFSDGHTENLNIQSTMAKVDEMVLNNVDIIDIGGCSTRPGSEQPTVEEELNRVLPILKEIKKKYGENVIVSIDTYRSRVAEEAILLGADIINDISAGQFDDAMYDVIAKYNVPYVINHTRGNISNMNSLTNYSKTSEDDELIVINERESNEDIIISEVSKELSSLISRMYAHNIKRWQIILDPGLGFAKKLNENLSVIRNLPYMKKYQQFNKVTKEYITFKYMPILLGPSRKKFIGTITGKETASERINGTSASITAGIGFGSDIVRVHDFKEMKDVCLMGDAIYKNLH